MRRSRRLLLDLGAGGLATAGLAAVVFVCTVALARLLPVEQFGHVSLILLLFNLTSVFDAVRPVTIFFATRYPQDRAAVLTSVLGIDIAIGATVSAAIALFGVAFDGAWFSFTELLWLAVASFLFFLQSAFWGWADAHGLVARTSVARAALMSLVYGAFVVLAFLQSDKAIYTAVLAIVSGIGCVWFWRMCHTRGLVSIDARLEKKIAAALARDVFRYMQFNFATLVLATADRFAIAAQAGPRSLGWYSAHFELATRPIGFARAIQSVLNPHMTNAVAQRADVFPVWGRYTKVVFLVTSFGAWSATLLRDDFASWILGPQYTGTSNIFGVVVLAQCFVVIGYACALLLNSVGDFRLQQRYYVRAALAMALAVVPVVSIGEIFAVAVLYFVVRGVDLLLLYSALRLVGRKVQVTGSIAVVTLWVATSSFAWMGEPLLVAAGGGLLAFILIRTRLTRSPTWA